MPRIEDWLFRKIDACADGERIKSALGWVQDKGDAEQENTCESNAADAKVPNAKADP
jgi:hypothetical protein